jgi:hypothetical protein
MRWCLTLFVLVSLAGCQQTRNLPDDLKYHVISIDEDGRPENPLVEQQRLDDWQYKADIRAVLEHMTRYLEQSPDRRVVIFIHGGLNEPDTSLQRAAQLYRTMRDEDGCYPLFINWNSGLLSSYLEQASSIRQGAKYEDDRARPWGVMASPLFVLADVGRAVFRTPIVWSQQVITEHDVTDWWESSAQQRQSSQFGKGARLYEVGRRSEMLQQLQRDAPEDSIRISLGRDRMSRNEWSRRGAAYMMTVPAKYSISPMLDLVQPAWENMYRRTQMVWIGPPIHVTAKTSQQALLEDVQGRGHGALQQFMSAFIHSPAVTAHRRIDLVGHSMGCIVLNELIRRFPQADYSNVVYMGAACSIQEFQRCVIPYLEDHPQTQFYNLCLHPMADDMETHALDLPPRGSLLVWIDNFLADPQTPMEWTLGRWENVVLASGIFYPVRKQVSVKSFDLLPRDAPRAGNPQEHGDFTLQRFWDPDFWRVQPAFTPSDAALPAERPAAFRPSPPADAAMSD